MCNWVRKPYSDTSANLENLAFCQEEELCELQSDRTVKIVFLLYRFLMMVHNIITEFSGFVHRPALYVCIRIQCF
jgi:hypothetical protein